MAKSALFRFEGNTAHSSLIMQKKGVVHIDNIVAFIMSLLGLVGQPIRMQKTSIQDLHNFKNGKMIKRWLIFLVDMLIKPV